MGKDKILVLPQTEEALRRLARLRQRKADSAALAAEGNNAFERAFNRAWQRLSREFGSRYTNRQMWDMAERLIANAPIRKAN